MYMVTSNVFLVVSLFANNRHNGTKLFTGLHLWQTPWPSSRPVDVQQNVFFVFICFLFFFFKKTLHVLSGRDGRSPWTQQSPPLPQAFFFV